MAVTDIITKICTKCGETKSVTEFRKQAGARDGLRTCCKTCASASDAAYRAANVEKVKAYAAAYRADNTENAKAAGAKWRAANRERAIAARAANAEKKKAYDAAWRAANPGVGRINSHNYRARKRDNGGTLSSGLAEKLFRLQRGKCACCHVSIDDGNHMDHVIPVALGGPNEDWNMQLLCGPCNMSKGAKHPVDFMQQRGFLL